MYRSNFPPILGCKSTWTAFKDRQRGATVGLGTRDKGTGKNKKTKKKQYNEYATLLRSKKKGQHVREIKKGNENKIK